MEQQRIHYFPVSGDRVITGLLPSGEYVAYDDNDDRVRGHGDTRLAAIADMVEKKHAYEERFC